MWNNYRFIHLTRASCFRSVSKTISIPEDLGHGTTRELVTVDVAFLTDRQNFGEIFSVVLGFLSGVIAFHGLLFRDWGWLLMCSGNTSMHHTLLESANWWTRVWQQHVRFLGWLMNFLWTPSTFMLMIPLLLSMVTLTDSRKGFPRMMEVCWRGSISMTMKSTKVEESWNSINTSFSIP
jgi:hypothetical protein